MEEVKRTSTTTVLKLRKIKAPIGLYKATGDKPKGATFVTAGPNGHPLRAESKAVASPPENVDEKASPFGLEEAFANPDDPGSDTPPATEPPSSEPGEYRQVLVEEKTGEEVPKEKIRKGIRRSSGDFVDLTDHLEKIEEDARLEAMEILTFVSRNRIPRERITGSYWVGARTRDEEDQFEAAPVLKTLFLAMKAEGRVAIVRWTKMKGQTIGIMAPHAAGTFIVHELVWAAQARRPNARCLAHQHAAVRETAVEQARELIASMGGKRADLDSLRDSRWAAEAELVARAEAGELDDFTIEIDEEPVEMEKLEAALEAAAVAS